MTQVLEVYHRDFGVFFRAGDGGQGLVHARQAHYITELHPEPQTLTFNLSKMGATEGCWSED
jgi:hypothetical protein